MGEVCVCLRRRKEEKDNKEAIFFLVSRGLLTA